MLWNIGGGYPGEPCKTTPGDRGYFSFCVAEDADANPWEPLDVERGLRDRLKGQSPKQVIEFEGFP